MRAGRVLSGQGCGAGGCWRRRPGCSPSALWSSQIHKSVGEALLIVGIFLIASRGYESSRDDASPSIVVGIIVLLVITPALFARRQQCLRTTEPPALHDAVS